MCTAMRKRYALLVGIDLYLNDGSRTSSSFGELALHNLRGCTNDVEAICNFLQDEYEFENISILTSSISVFNNQESVPERPVEPPERLPTFANLKAEFDNIYDRAVAGDFFFFHYSGHGALLRRQKDSPKSNLLDPSLITVDFCCGQPAVRGWQLNQWLRRLNEKGIQIVVTLDSCYSGGSWRSTGEYKSFRTPSDWLPVPNLSIDDQAAENSIETTERASRDTKLETSWSINPENFTLMTACGSKEYAAEKIVNGKKYGAFTWELLDYLRHSKNRSGRVLNVTYRMISDQLRVCLEGQTPEVYGRDRLLFFGNYEPFSATPIVVQVEGNKVLIPVGSAHGVNMGSEFMVSSDLPNITIFPVDEVEELQCSAIINDKLLLLLKHFRHTVKLYRWNLGEQGTLRVYVDLAFDADFRSQLQDRLQERFVSRVELLESTKNYTDVLQLNRVGEDDATVRGPAWLTGSDDPVRPLNLKNGNPNELAASAALSLAHLALFRHILLLRNQRSSKLPFNVTIKPVDGGVAIPHPLDQKFRFTFDNNSDDELHITVIVFSSEFSIEQLYPSRDYPQIISKRQKKSFNFSMTLPNGPKWVQESRCRTFRRDIVRTLVTRGERVSWKCLELPNIWDISRAESNDKQSTTRNGSSVPGSDVSWWLHDEEIITGSAELV
ncbi:caspase domain-containing protein [Trichoderma camerunense]